MRIGLAIEVGNWQTLCAEARTAEMAGLDAAWLGETLGRAGATSALVAACALAPVTRHLRVLAEVPAGTHPVGLAEQISVADQLLGGRLTAVVSGSDASLVGETLDVLQAALAARPFRHSGTRWTLPRTPGAWIRVTPAPAQLELPIWLCGPLAELAAERGAPCFDELDCVRPGRAHPAFFAPAMTTGGALDVTATVEQLLQLRSAGVDVAVARLSDQLPGPARRDAAQLLGSRVRPLVQLDHLAEEVIGTWDA